MALMNGSDAHLPGLPNLPSTVRYGNRGRRPSWAELQERRKGRLLQELLDEEVHLLPTDASGRPYVNGMQYVEHEQLIDMLVDELSYARWPPVHEERRSSYGSLVLPNDGWLGRHPIDAKVGVLVQLSGDDPTQHELSPVRPYANGRTTFLVRSPQGPEGLLELPPADELTIVRLVQDLGAFVVQRTPAGAIKIFVQHRLYVFEHDLWSVKPYADPRRLQQYVSTENKVLLSSLLNFCLHNLSARHVGATLVWCLDGDCPGMQSGRDGDGFPSAVTIRLDQPQHLEALSTLLASIDGACLLKADGTVMRIGVKLEASDRANRLKRDGGTRHTSAKRFSFDQPQTLVLVVSQDGPVSVYRKGRRIELLKSTETIRNQIHLICPACKYSSWIPISRSIRYPRPCPNCGEASMRRGSS
jgi:DNA integrity scanning protein DisA with diadenylate cyclase activity